MEFVPPSKLDVDEFMAKVEDGDSDDDDTIIALELLKDHMVEVIQNPTSSTKIMLPIASLDGVKVTVWLLFAAVTCVTVPKSGKEEGEDAEEKTLCMDGGCTLVAGIIQGFKMNHVLKAQLVEARPNFLSVRLYRWIWRFASMTLKNRKFDTIANVFLDSETLKKRASFMKMKSQLKNCCEMADPKDPSVWSSLFDSAEECGVCWDKTIGKSKSCRHSICMRCESNLVVRTCPTCRVKL